MTDKRHMDYVRDVSAPFRTLLIIGTATDGPSEELFRVRPGLRPSTVLGYGPMQQAVAQAQRAGVQDIILYRLNGQPAKGNIDTPATDQLLAFESISSGSKYNQTSIHIDAHRLYISMQDGRSRAYHYADYRRLGDMVSQMKQDAFIGLLDFQTATRYDHSSFDELRAMDTTVTFYGGQDENHLHGNSAHLSASALSTLKERLSFALFGPSDDDAKRRIPHGDLGLVPFGVLSLAGLCHEDDWEWADMLGAFGRNKAEEEGYGCFSVLGTRPIPSEGLTDAYIDRLRQVPREEPLSGPETNDEEEETLPGEDTVVSASGVPEHRHEGRMEVVDDEGFEAMESDPVFSVQGGDHIHDGQEQPIDEEEAANNDIPGSNVYMDKDHEWYGGDAGDAPAILISQNVRRPIDPHAFVAVVVGETATRLDDLGTIGSVSVAPSYASLLALSDPATDPLNKSIPGLTQLSQHFSASSIDLLASSGYTLIARSVRRGMVPVRTSTWTGYTASPFTSPLYARLSLALSRLVFRALDNMVGSPMDVSPEAQIRQRLQQPLEAWARDGWIRSYAITIEPPTRYGVYRVHLQISTYTSVGTVHTTTNMPLPEGG